MIIPQPKDLPPRALSASRELTQSVQSNTTNAQRYAFDVENRFKQSNTGLQFLSQQVQLLSQYINSLPGTTQVYNALSGGIAPSTSWVTATSVNVVLPAGFTSVDIFGMGIARIVDTTAPFITTGMSRILVNGVAGTEINQRYPWNAVPPENLANSSVARTVNGNALIEFQLIEDQAAQGNANAFAQLCVFAVFY